MPLKRRFPRRRVGFAVRPAGREAGGRSAPLGGPPGGRTDHPAIALPNALDRGIYAQQAYLVRTTVRPQSAKSSVCSKPHPWPSIQGCGPVVALSGLGARTQQGNPAPSYSQSGLSRSGSPFPTRPSHALPTARHVEKMITNIFAADCHTSGIALRRNPNQRSGGTDSAGSRNSLQDRVWLRPFRTYPHMVRGHSWSPPHTGEWPPAAEPAPAALVHRQQRRLGNRRDLHHRLARGGIHHRHRLVGMPGMGIFD
jgi:hypothetical protein